MISLTKPEKSTLGWSLIMGLILFAISGIEFWSYVKQDHETPGIFTILQYSYPILFVFAEAFVLKNWKKYGLIVLTYLTYIILVRQIPITTSNYEAINIFHKLVPGTLIFMLLRNYLFKKNRSFLTVLLGAYLINAVSTSSYNIIYELSRFIDQGGRFSNPAPFYLLLSSAVFWALLLLFDRISPPLRSEKSIYDLKTDISQQIYFKRVALLSLLQFLLLALLIIGLTGAMKKLTGHGFNNNVDTIGIYVSMLFIHSLIYILSIKRLIGTDQKETYLYWFAIPFLNIIPAYLLSKAKAGSMYQDQIRADRMLVFCRNCENRFNDLKRGLLCGLTSEKPDFSNLCPDFKMLDKTKPLQKKLAPTGQTKFLMVFLTTLILYTVFLIFVMVVGGRSAPFIESIVTITVFWTLSYFIYDQKLWAAGVFMALITFSVISNVYGINNGRIESFLLIMYMTLSFLLVIGIMPAWRYLADKPSRLEDVIEV